MLPQLTCSYTTGWDSTRESPLRHETTPRPRRPSGRVLSCLVSPLRHAPARRRFTTCRAAARRARPPARTRRARRSSPGRRRGYEYAPCRSPPHPGTPARRPPRPRPAPASGRSSPTSTLDQLGVDLYGNPARRHDSMMPATRTTQQRPLLPVGSLQVSRHTADRLLITDRRATGRPTDFSNLYPTSRRHEGLSTANRGNDRQDRK